MEFSPLIHFFIVVISGSLIWFSGTRLAIYSDWIAHRYQIGRAFVGALLLAFVTSSPEFATTITASWIGNASLAIGNLLGSVNLQTFAIALADICFVSGALTYFSPKTSLLIGGIFVVLQLAVVSVAFTYGELFSFWGIGFWPLLLFIIYLLMLYFMLHHEKNKRWAPVNVEVQEAMKIPVPAKRDYSNFRLWVFFSLNALFVFVAGWAIAYFSDKLAIQWHWSGNWMGATLVALTTSLPEISTTLGAVRQKAYVLAIANIFGSNALTIALLFVADLFYQKGPIVNAANSSDLFLVGVGVALTAIFLWGILERRNKTIFCMGLDSFFAFITYLASLVLLYKISG